MVMKSISLSNLKRIKRALQKKKITRIDAFRIQIGKCDFPGNRDNLVGVQQEIFTDENKRILYIQKDSNQVLDFKLLSNTAVTHIDIVSS